MRSPWKEGEIRLEVEKVDLSPAWKFWKKICSYTVHKNQQSYIIKYR